MKQIFAATALALTAGATPLLAGSLTPAVEEPITMAPAPVISTGGEWTGFYGGIQVGNLDVDGTGTADGDDTAYGVHAGYNYDMGQWVLGGELDYDTTDIDLGGAATVDNVARLKLKAGYDLGRTMIYATAGAARVDTTLGSDTGGFGGIGLSYAVSDNFIIGGEYLRHKFSDIGGSGVDADADSISLRASFRF